MSRFRTRTLYPNGFSLWQFIKHKSVNTFHLVIVFGIIAVFVFVLFDHPAEAHLPESDGRGPSHVEAPRILVIHHTEISLAEHPAQFEMANASHQRRWDFKSPVTGYYLCYHYFIGSDGTVIQARGDEERPGCTRNKGVNDRAIQVVLAGNFEIEKPTRPQLVALRGLVDKLDGKYHFDRIIPHREASPTSCPGKNLLDSIQDVLREPKIPGIEFQVSRYYTPVRGQRRYYRKTYEEDFAVNCSGDCFTTADGTDLHNVEPMTLAACPPSYKFGQKIELDGIGVVTCHDHGGAIKGNRIDVWAGVGDEALDLLPVTKAGKMTGRLL